MDINQYKKDAEDFLGKVDKEYYLHFSGQKTTLDLDDIYKQFEYLFSFEKSQYFKNLINTKDIDNTKFFNKLEKETV